MTATSSIEQNTAVDSTRGSLLTDIQMSTLTTPMPSNVTQLALNDTTKHEIMSILERPVNLGTSVWESDDSPIPIQLTYNDFAFDTPNYLQQFNFPQDIFANSTIVVDKLKNYQYMKADIEIEIKINAQPFLQGALMLVYNPYYNQTEGFRRVGTRFMASQTSCPYKIVSIEDGNSIKLICPYANIYDLFDLSNADNQFGTVFLYVFSALRGSSAGEAVKYTSFARFINPQFFVPTQNEVMPAIRDAHDVKRLEAKGFSVTRHAQASVEPVSAPDTGEVEATGPVSKIASGVTLISDVLSGVPLIGDIASSVAWVSRVIGRTAASLGFSKPTGIAPQCKMIVKPTHTLIHTEGNDDSVTLALLQDNGIDGSSIIPEKADEMSLAYIFGRPNFFHSQETTAATFSDRKLLTVWEVSPFSQYQYGEQDDPDTLFLGSFSYASMLGTLWRGTINYDVMVVKTPYHQGRFAVVFLPETNINDVPDTLGELLNTNYNVVCNLKETQDELGRTVFRVSVPFISNVPWRETYKTDASGESKIAPDATTLDTKTGCLAIYSLVDLSFPPTVSDAVTFYIAHSGGEDYQISRPTIQLAPGYSSRYAQSDIGAVVIPTDENLLVPSHTSRDVTAQTTGEYFTSLRALIKRFNFFSLLSQNENFTGLRTRHMMEEPLTGRRTMSRQSFQDYVLPTSWYMSSFLFRFYNGSSMLKVLPPQTGMVSEAFLQYDEEMANQNTLSQINAVGQPLFQQLQAVSNAFEIRTPYYRGIRCDVVSSNQVPVLGDVRTCVRSQNRGGFGNQTAPSYMYEAAGDDFNFFFLIGPPPMSDIHNITAVPTLPTGTNRIVDFSTLAFGEDGTIVFTAQPPGFNPSLPLSIGTRYQIAQSDLPSITITYLDLSTDVIPVVNCEIENTLSGPGFVIPIPLTKTVNAIITIPALALLGSFNIVDNGPVA